MRLHNTNYLLSSFMQQPVQSKGSSREASSIFLNWVLKRGQFGTLFSHVCVWAEENDLEKGGTAESYLKEYKIIFHEFKITIVKYANTQSETQAVCDGVQR